MDAQEIPIRECVFEFRHCLEGKARMWYDEITLPRTWNELIDHVLCPVLHLR